MSLFNKTVQKSNEWIREIMQQMNTGSEQEALLALRGTLHALRDRLPVDELAQLGAQLPTLIRGFYYEGWNPAHAPAKYRHISEFLERIRKEFPADAYLDFEFVARAVLSVLARRISFGEFRDIRSNLPEELRDLMRVEVRSRI